MFETNPTWASFIDFVKEQYYPMGNYDEQYTKWTKVLDGVGVHQQLSYLAYKVGYQELRVTPDTEISQWSTSIHPN